MKTTKEDKIIEEWYQKLSIQYLGKRDCVFEADKSNIEELKKLLK